MNLLQDFALGLIIAVLLCNSFGRTSGSILGGRFQLSRIATLDIRNFAPPSVAAVKKNYRGDVTRVITRVSNSQATLPPLRFEDHNFEGQSIELECNATYPVQWTYSGVGAPPVHLRTHRIALDFFDQDTYIYQSSVVFTHTTEQQTGNYTCQSMDPTRPDLESFLYLFVPGSGVFLAEVEEIQTVVATEEEPWVTLPCAVSDSEARVILLKKHSVTGIEALRTGRHLTFDPKMGFQMQWREFNEPWANYSCIATTEETMEQLDIVLSPPQRKPIILANPPDFDNWAPGVRFIVDAENNRILCCSNTNERPAMKSTGCTSVPDCNLRKKYLEAKRCPPSCEQHVVNVGRTCVAYEMSEMHDESGMLRCSRGDSVDYFMFSKDQEMITNFTQLPQINKILNMYIEAAPKPGKLFVSCHGNPFFFSNGLKWAWKRPNGTLEIIPEQRPPAPSYLEVDKMENLGSSIYCFAPLSNSATAWKSKSMVIK